MSSVAGIHPQDETRLTGVIPCPLLCLLAYICQCGQAATCHPPASLPRQQLGRSSTGHWDHRLYLHHQVPQSSPVKQWLLPAVEGILQVSHQVGLAWHAEEPLLSETPLPDEVHTLFHQQGCQAGAILPFMMHGIFQALPKDPWAQRGAGHTLCHPA